MGAECNQFILGLAKRVEPAEAMMENRQDHNSIMQKLCA